MCETNINDCASAPCANGARCEDGIDKFVCKCEPGYTGTRCQHTVDDCASQPCQNGASCQDMLDGFQCKCRPGFVGKLGGHLRYKRALEFRRGTRFNWILD